VLQAASVLNVPELSSAHAPVVPVQLYITPHVEAQLVFVSAPDPAVHVFVVGSLHV
jgi:hypothetical protein